MDAEAALDDFIDFCHVDPQLPDAGSRTFSEVGEGLEIDLEMGRTDIIARLEELRGRNRYADLAFYARRDLSRTDVEPFLAAAVDRNPVSLEGASGMDTAELFDHLKALPAESIYDEPGQLAQPDEVWNFGLGDGLEKAITMAAVLRGQGMNGEMTLSIGSGEVVLRGDGEQWSFPTSKGLEGREWIIPERSL